MKAIILSGGLAKRLYPLTEFTPKPLLPVIGKPIIKHIIEKIELINEVNKIYISTNEKFQKHFNNFIKSNLFKKEVKLVIDETVLDEKIGAIGALNSLINKENLNEDILIILGDNLFDFTLTDFCNYYKIKNTPIVAFYEIGSIKQAKNFGIAILDENNKIIDFDEKSENPRTTLVSTGCYIIPKNSLYFLSQYIKNNNNPDAPGYFIKWLSVKKPIHGFNFKGRWFDIGNLENYKQANIEYNKNM